MAWLETAGALLLTLGGAALGVGVGRLRSPWWFIGYALPLLLIGLIAAPRRIPHLEFSAPFSWLVGGRLEFVILGPAVACLFLTINPHLKSRSIRWVALAFMVVAILVFTLLPFGLGAFNQRRFEQLQTSFDEDDVCLQSTAVTCGPAAAVTAIRSLGLLADESDLAVRCRSNLLWGTPADVLAAVLRDRYPAELVVTFRPFDSVSELAGQEPVLVSTRYGPLVDHYLVVLKVEANSVLVADPLRGQREMTEQELRAVWRGTGITLSRGR